MAAQKFVAELKKFESKLWGFHFYVPSEKAQHLIEGKDRRVVSEIKIRNQSHEWQCAILFDGEGGCFITVNKGIRDKLNLVLGDELNVTLLKDRSKYGMPMPEEFEVAMDQDPEGKEYFDELTPGKQRNLLYIVNEAKNVDRKIKRCLIILDHLKWQKGNVEFKALNQALKGF